jgi:zinc-ribbon domain
MVCKKCQTELPEEARVCSQCGAPAQSQSSNVQSEQNITTLKGTAIGLIDHRKEVPAGSSINIRSKIETIENGGTAIGGIFGAESGNVHVGGQQNYDHREINTGGGAYVNGGVNTGGGDFVGRDKNVHQGVSGAELAALFDLIYRRIEARPEDPGVDQEELKESVSRIQKEVGKGEKANTGKIQRWLNVLADVAPDILEVTISSLLNPAAGVASAIRWVVEKVKQERSS